MVEAVTVATPVLRPRQQAPGDVRRRCEHGRSARIPAPHPAPAPARRRTARAGGAMGDAAVADTVGDAAAAATLAHRRSVAAAAARLQGQRHDRGGTAARHRARGDAEPRLPPARRRALPGVWRRSEIILLSNLRGDGEKLAALQSAWRIEDEERTYPMPRRDSHAWFAVTGRHAPAMFAKLCAVDLRLDHFPDLSIAQTSIAKMSAIVTRADYRRERRPSTCLRTARPPCTSAIVSATPPRSSAGRSWVSRPCKI